MATKKESDKAKIHQGLISAKKLKLQHVWHNPETYRENEAEARRVKSPGEINRQKVLAINLRYQEEGKARELEQKVLAIKLKYQEEGKARELDQQKEIEEPLAKLSNGKRSKLIKAPDKPVFLSRLLTIRPFTQLLCRFCKNQGIVVPTIHKIILL